jgi:nucleoside-diphosphate-sugar epimerase
MAENGSILVTGAAGQLGAVGRTVTGLLLERGLRVRAMVRREDDRAAALRAAGAEVVVGGSPSAWPCPPGTWRPP